MIVGHSQGTFFAEDVFNELLPDIKKRTRILAISPFTSFKDIDKSQVAYLLREDDIPNVLNRISDNLDSAKKKIRKISTEISNSLPADLTKSLRNISDLFTEIEESVKKTVISGKRYVLSPIKNAQKTVQKITGEVSLSNEYEAKLIRLVKKAQKGINENGKVSFSTPPKANLPEWGWKETKNGIERDSEHQRLLLTSDLRVANISPLLNHR
ncbi:MAG: hypothetical protein F6K23_38980 [Okeania sp. SIO2C9]|uniref:hypothetical protein n=1 Tax=Okeania sp. SIO2C9 TaxID=2607791 RepID=UPI0013C19FE2|nr:hypothetical protein [Okeania sp. SIO2C9]NEQ78454.1 hypothetical protein [Okeania sp. SIO2C9]